MRGYASWRGPVPLEQSTEAALVASDTAQTAAASAPNAIAALPEFRRARPRDALDIAYATFLDGARVDMGTLAQQLDVSRATLYRWFDSRDQLLEQVLSRLADEFSASARAEAEGEGDERVLDFVRHIMLTTVGFQPIRSFVEREPQLALRLLIGQNGAVHRSLARALFEVIAETHSARDAKALEDAIDDVVQVGTSLQWATLAIGEEPQIERAVGVIRALLATGRA
jgi:AcrR family transcriptional regulator